MGREGRLNEHMQHLLPPGCRLNEHMQQRMQQRLLGVELAHE